jgi:hypothetical protein
MGPEAATIRGAQASRKYTYESRDAKYPDPIGMPLNFCVSTVIRHPRAVISADAVSTESGHFASLEFD